MSSDVEKFVNFCKSELGNKITNKEAEYIRRELKSVDKILNVGCGIGWLEEKLPSFNIVGLDNSEEMLKEARKRSDKTFVLGDAEKMHFEDSFFDAIVFITTLEFLPDYKRAISEAARVLKPNGKLIAMLLNPESEYFKRHIQNRDSYFQRVKNTNLEEIESYVRKFFEIRTEYFLGIKGGDVFDSSDKNFASLYVIRGSKR